MVFVVLAVVLCGIGAVVVAGTSAQSRTTGIFAFPSSVTDLPTSAEGGSAAGESMPSTGDDVINLSATGDIVLGNAPSSLPPHDGQGFFNEVKESLKSDLSMGNLEEALTEETGTAKCPSESGAKTCFAFRAPPRYAKVLHDAGFRLINIANNHSFDYGQTGYTNTQSALTAVGLYYTGKVGLITIVTVNKMRIAVVGFAPYPWANNPNDLARARRIIEEASGKADLVVVQAHLGAEGADKNHVRPGTEMFLGENRGDPLQFAHTVVDAGADIVIGHGPHVLRGMEFYKGRLIAYSLGNFAGYKTLSYSGAVGLGGILTVAIRRDGSYSGGSLTSTMMVSPGVPKLDPTRRSAAMVAQLSLEDFPSTGARVDSAGRISAP